MKSKDRKQTFSLWYLLAALVVLNLVFAFLQATVVPTLWRKSVTSIFACCASFAA